MTASGQRVSAEKVAAPKPIACGQGQAAKMTDPLPDGWAHFCSKPDRNYQLPSRWYATAPYSVSEEMGRAGMAPTVDASTWPALHVAVAAQVDLYRVWAGQDD